LLTVIGAVLLQTLIAGYMTGGRWIFDLVLVGVVFAGLTWGPAAGILAGTVGGLLQDLMAGGIVGISGLTKTITGCLAGAIGTQFVLTEPHARALVVAGATVVNRLSVLGLYALIDQRWSGFGWGAMLAETALNALAALLLFHATSAVPGALSKQRLSRRSSLSRRQW
jgi:rod shape-determining protein MreD